MTRRIIVILLPILVLTVASVALAENNFENPLNSAFNSIPLFIAGFLKLLVMIALPIISLFVVYSGFLFVWARGNEAELTKAKTNFFYVIIGAILILGAWVIATLLAGTVTQLVNGL
ncbi:MAG TPA: hypothetical protein VJB97_01560 [Candidatus Paceibacterota bacterium]